jgi:hypothetical protein
MPLSAGRSLIEVALRSPQGITVDLHYRLFSFGRYGLTTADLFHRAQRDESYVRAPLWMPYGLDVLSHLIGKWVSDQLSGDVSRRHHVSRAVDIALAYTHYGRPAKQLAQHLRRYGLGRAARFALPRAARLTGDASLLDPIAFLPRDPLAPAYLTSGELGFRHLPPTWSALPAHLLNGSTGAAGLSLGGSLLCRGLHRSLSALPHRCLGAWAGFFPAQH